MDDYLRPLVSCRFYTAITRKKKNLSKKKCFYKFSRSLNIYIYIYIYFDYFVINFSSEDAFIYS